MVCFHLWLDNRIPKARAAVLSRPKDSVWTQPIACRRYVPLRSSGFRRARLTAETPPPSAEVNDRKAACRERQLMAGTTRSLHARRAATREVSVHCERPLTSSVPDSRSRPRADLREPLLPGKLRRMIVRVLGLLLLLCAAYLGNSFLQVQSFSTGLWTLWALICGLGLIVQRKWAAYLWYALASFASLGWIWAVVGVVRSGWPYPDALTSAISLVPGVCVLAIRWLGSFAVFKQFHPPSRVSGSDR